MFFIIANPAPFCHIHAQFPIAGTGQGVLSLRKKEANIAGLQVADILAYPCKQEILEERKLISPIADIFGKDLCTCVADKYNRRTAANKIDGYGKVFLS